jgi:NOL1/NOP2/fmu family ribosome biogenesis protein
LAELRFLVRGRNVWAVTDLDGLDDALGSLKVEAAGVPFLRSQRHMWKPTTAALLFLDAAVTKNVVDLTEEQLQPFLRGEMLLGPFVVDGGYVAIRYEEKMLGCALYGKAGLKSQLPRAWVAVLRGGKPEMAEE